MAELAAQGRNPDHEREVGGELEEVVDVDEEEWNKVDSDNGYVFEIRPPLDDFDEE